MKKILIVLLVIVVAMAMVSPVMAMSNPPRPARDGVDGVDGQDGVQGVQGDTGRAGNDYSRSDEIGLGLDIALYEQGDGVGNLDDVRWLRGITVESRMDLNNGEPSYTGYLVTKIKLWNK